MAQLSFGGTSTFTSNAPFLLFILFSLSSSLPHPSARHDRYMPKILATFQIAPGSYAVALSDTHFATTCGDGHMQVRVAALDNHDHLILIQSLTYLLDLCYIPVLIALSHHP